MSDDISVRIGNPFAPPRADVRDAAPRAAEGQVLATRSARFGATMIDFGSVAVIGIVAAVAVPRIHAGSTPISNVLIGVFVVLGMAWLAMSIFSIVLCHRQGQTVGKRLMGVRVVRTDGSRASFGRIVLLRNIAPNIFAKVPYAGPCFSLVNYLFIFGASRRCLHDWIADTMVVTADSSIDATLDGAKRWQR